jgi:hypothetical protein
LAKNQPEIYNFSKAGHEEVKHEDIKQEEEVIIMQIAPPPAVVVETVEPKSPAFKIRKNTPVKSLRNSIGKENPKP